MNAFEFIHWCFRTPMSGLITFVLIVFFVSALVEMVRALGDHSR